MSETNAQKIRRMIEAFNKGEQEAVIRDIADPGFRIGNAPEGQPDDLEGWIAMAKMFRTAFPDVHVTIKNLISDGDHVVAYEVSTGTHNGELMGIPPTGKSATIETMHIFRFSNGKVVERCSLFDMFGLFSQLGVMDASAG